MLIGIILPRGLCEFRCRGMIGQGEQPACDDMALARAWRASRENGCGAT